MSKIKKFVPWSILIPAGILFFTSFETSVTTTPYHFPELEHFPKMPVNRDNPVTVEGAKLGRYLFYDPILSHDSTFSCSSCHKQSNAFSDSPNQFSKGSHGDLMKRNTPALFNLAWYPALFWDGRAANVEQQIFTPVRRHDEMDLDWITVEKRINASTFYVKKFHAAFGDEKIDSILISKAIAQFVRTLLSYRSKYDKVIQAEAQYTTFEYEGFVLVNDQTKGNCLHCHTTDADALGTTLKFSNNGLDSAVDIKDYKDPGRGAITGKASDYGNFKIPSLRNIALTAPYMHDGRFKTLKEVLDFYSSGVHNSINIDSKMAFVNRHGLRLTELEKQKIIAFLNCLTDSSFVKDQEFGNPFVK